MLSRSREIKDIVKRALKEDIAGKDITTALVIPRGVKAEGVIIANEGGVLCGIGVVKETFFAKDKRVIFRYFKKDGTAFKKNEEICHIKTEASIILACERVALNFLSRFSGIATLTRRFVEKTKGTKAKIMDTRKTTPNLRILEKYAVKVGGGYNHRNSLEEALLIKDNHLRAGSLLFKGRLKRSKFSELMRKLKKEVKLKIEVEVENLSEFKETIKHKPNIIMLDNFFPSALKKAVIFRNRYYPQVRLEASGGIRLNSVKRLAACGVDFISVGALTHSYKAIDFSLEIISSE